MKELERTLKALANRRRLAILAYIKKRREAAVTEVAKEIKLSVKATSKHLIILFSAHILDKEQRSSLVFYSLRADQKPGAKHILKLL